MSADQSMSVVIAGYTVVAHVYGDNVFVFVHDGVALDENIIHAFAATPTSWMTGTLLELCRSYPAIRWTVDMWQLSPDHFEQAYRQIMAYRGSN